MQRGELQSKGRCGLKSDCAKFIIIKLRKHIMGTCGAGVNCAGGGGACGAGVNCAGGGGICGAGVNCAGGGGVCGAGINCTGS